MHGAWINGTVQVPCGKCFACQSNRRRDWHMRIKYEMLHCLQSFTVTLTYDNLHLQEIEYFVDDKNKKMCENALSFIFANDKEIFKKYIM